MIVKKAILFSLALFLLSCAEITGPEPPRAWIKDVTVTPLSCPAEELECPPGLNIYYVTLGGDFAGMRLTIEGAESYPDTLQLPHDPLAASGLSEPKITYALHHVWPLDKAKPVLIARR